MFYCLFYSSVCLKYGSTVLLENGNLAYVLTQLPRGGREITVFGVYRICETQSIDSAFHCVVKSIFTVYSESLCKFCTEFLGFIKHHHKMLNISLTNLLPSHARIFANYFSDCFLDV